MTYLITALDAEARPLIEYYRLKRDYTLPFTLYRSEEIVLLVTQPGKTNALMATSALLGHILPKAEDILINIGICGAPEEYPIGEALLIHKIIDNGRSFYPDILYPHPYREATLISLQAAQDSMLESPVDMESSSVFRAASKFFSLHRIAFLKIVSDHFKPDTVTKEKVIESLRSHRKTLDILINSLKHVTDTKPLFTAEEFKEINDFKSHFTVSQGAILEEALCYFRLRYPALPLPFPDEEIPPSKRERSELLERFTATLVS
ncbi:MAG: hypothetical protein AB7U44_06675 [Sulfuricurvum sp.]